MSPEEHLSLRPNKVPVQVSERILPRRADQTFPLSCFYKVVEMKREQPSFGALGGRAEPFGAWEDGSLSASNPVHKIKIGFK